MPRPRKVVQPRRLNLHLPEDKLARLDLFLFSDVEGRIPQGAYQEFFGALLDGWFAERARCRYPDCAEENEDKRCPLD